MVRKIKAKLVLRLRAEGFTGRQIEPPEVSCRIFLSQEGWHHAKENRSRCEGAGVASAA